MHTKYDHLAENYDRRWQSYIEATLEAVLETVDFQGDEKVLDVPCGTGELEQRLLAKWPGLCITGADISTGMLTQAKAKEGANRVRWIETDVVGLSVSDERFDCVLCVNSFHYFRSPNEALAAMHRVLRPGGRLLLVDWCDDYWTCRVCSLWQRLTDKAFHRTYSLKACVDLLQENGFEIEHRRRFRMNWLWGLMLLDSRRRE